MKTTFQKLVDLEGDFRNRAKYVLDKFQTNFAQNPSHAFEWSSDAFDAAGKLHVADCLNAWLGSDVDKLSESQKHVKANGIIEEATRMVIRAGRFPERSTSQQTNLMAAARIAAFAEVLDRVSNGGL